VRLALDPADPDTVHMSFDNERTECGQVAGPEPEPGRKVTCDVCKVHTQAHSAKMSAVMRERWQRRRG
jgi:hypothetical protein